MRSATAGGGGGRLLSPLHVFRDISVSMALSHQSTTENFAKFGSFE